MKLSKKEIIARIEYSKELVNRYLMEEVITEKDLLGLIQVDDGFSITRTHSRSSRLHEYVLKEVYNSPFLLCDQKHLSKKIKSLLPIILFNRYKTELEELELQYNEGYINTEEYEDAKYFLKFCYYRSSEEGKRIFRKGEIDCIQNNKIKYK